MQLIIAFIIAVSMNAVATILLKIGAERAVFEFSAKALKSIVKNYYILGGLFLYFASFPAYLYIIKKMNVSIAYPVFTSLAFASTIIIAFIFLKEHLTIWQIFGLLLVVGGIALLATNNA